MCAIRANNGCVMREIWESEEVLNGCNRAIRFRQPYAVETKRLKADEFIMEIYMFHSMTACRIVELGSEPCSVVGFHALFSPMGTA